MCTMSVNYAAGLSYYPHKGKCGQPEFKDGVGELDQKIEQLTQMLKDSKFCVVLTGAGISTSCGIPDFRGPKGVWTLEQKGESPCFATTFDDASFSIGHLSLVALEKAGFVKFLITQNVDGLHLRSGFPYDKLAILHGDMFIEKCDKCHHRYVRRHSVTTMGLKPTGKTCGRESKRGMGCRGRLRDTILDWEDSLPDDQLDMAIENSRKADLFLVLGSSLQIVPAGNLPLHCRRRGGKFVSINLQKTKHHKNTDMVIHSNIDVVMEAVCKQLGVVIPQVSKPQVVLHSIHSDIKSCVPIDVSIDPVILTSCKSSLGNGSESHRSLSDDVTNFATRKRMKEEIDVKDMKKLKPDPL